MAMLSYAQELNSVSMFLEEMTELKNPSVIYKDNQGVISLAKNRQVGILTKHIDVCHHFLRKMVKDKDIDIYYIWSEYNPEYIMTKNTLEEYFAIQMKSIT